jgi:hypothetical protein
MTQRVFSFCRARHLVDTAFDTSSAEKSGDPPPLKPSFKVKGNFHDHHSGFVAVPWPARSQCAECFKGPRQNARWHSDEAAPLGGWGSEAASSKARAVLCSGEPLQHGARHEIKDFHGTLLSSWPPQLGHLENAFGFSERRQAGIVSSWRI